MVRRPTRPALRPLAALVVAGALLVGCGVKDSADGPPPTGESGPKAEATLRDAIRDTTAESRSAFDLKVGFTSSELGADQRFRLQGKADRDAGIVLGELSNGNGALSYRSNDTDTWVTTEADGWKEALDGRTWLHVRNGEVQGFDSIKESDASKTVVAYLAGAEDLRATGSKEVDGTSVATYDFRIAKDVISRMPRDQRAAGRRLITATGQGRLSTTGDVAIDGDGRVRQVHLRGEVRGPGDDASDPPRFLITYELTLGDFGTSVTLDQPSSDDVRELKDAPGAIRVLAKIQRS